MLGSQVPNRGSRTTSAFFSWSRMALTSLSVSGPPCCRMIDVARKSLVAWDALGTRCRAVLYRASGVQLPEVLTWPRTNGARMSTPSVCDSWIFWSGDMAGCC